MTSASKVGDLFSAAGEAFAKLAELTRILQATAKNDSHLSSNDNFNEAQWLASDTESLQMAVKRFGDELNVISEHIKDKTMYQIKSTFRKIQPTLSTSAATNEKSGTEASPTMASASFGGHDSGNAYSSDTAVVTASSALSSMVSTTPKAAASAQNASSSNSTLGSNSFPQPSASGVSSSAAAAASCSSPSPFLHYPLLRKSADITLNMLNARDDSDDDERVSMSVFNSV